MRLSIITINRNNETGLAKTLDSVIAQTSNSFEYIVVDGASIDDSVSLIQQASAKREIHWISEKDTGIYNAMNKGIRMAQGEYLMFLNSGDYLVDKCVVESIMSRAESENFPPILYGNIVKIWPDGHTHIDRGWSGNLTFLSFYQGALNHVGTLIKADLFSKYGFYNESLKICSDWEWFIRVIGIQGVSAVYTDLNTVYFDMTGVSEGGEESRAIIRQERKQVLQSLLPTAVLADYRQYDADLRMIRRLHRHPFAFRLVRFIERICFKLEK